MTVIREDNTGYSAESSGSNKTTKFWTLKRRHALTSLGEVVAHLTCDDEIVGLLYFDSEEDFEWMKRRLGIQIIQKKRKPTPG